MATYYRDHVDEFTTPARVKFEELMIRYKKYPTKTAAFDAIAQMGNQVFGGAPFAEVARRQSDSITAVKGGQWGWTSKGSLADPALERAVFELPLGQMSPIIEGERGYHIVRVLDREDKAVCPFLDTQVEIKQKIIDQRLKKQSKEYMAKLRERTPIWTVYDKPNSGMQMATPQFPQRVQ
jgi:parvulin-like peptidyl-prolyl isomerase